MKQIFFLGFCWVLLTGCNGIFSPILSGEIIDKPFSYNQIKSVHNFTSANIVFSNQAKNNELIIHGDKTLIDNLQINWNNGTLQIETKSKININTNTKNQLTIYINAPSIQNIQLGGSGDVTAKQYTLHQDLNIGITGSSDVKLAVDNDATSVNISGSGDVSLSGSTQNLQCHISGSGDFDGKRFMARQAVVSMSGSGDISVYVTEDLNAENSGSGDISYKNSSTLRIQSNNSGSGEIHPY